MILQSMQQQPCYYHYFCFKIYISAFDEVVYLLPWLKYLDDGENMLRRHLVEKDDEERFQADIKKAVRQSLGICPICLYPVYLLCMFHSTVHNSVILIYNLYTRCHKFIAPFPL